MQPRIRAAIAAGGTALLVATGVGAGLASADTGTTPGTIADALAAVEHAQTDLDQAREILIALQDDPTDPPTTTTPPPAQDVAATSTVLNDDQVRVDWVTTRTDITGWTIGRDGIDDFGTGAWATDLPPGAVTFTFNSLVAGAAYNFTLTGHTAGGDLTPVVVTATVGTPPTTTTPPPTTTNPPPTGGDGTTAAGLYGWGTPIPSMTDEFNYVGAPDGSKWYNPGSGSACWSGHSGNGKRCGDKSVVDGSKLVMSGDAAGNTGLLGQLTTRQYGRYELRVRSTNTGPANGREYHPLALIWPTSENWPGDGEYDFLENGRPGDDCVEAYIHYPHPNLPVQQEHAVEQNCGAPLTEWHNVAFEWAPNQVSGYVDGVQFFRYSGGANGSRSAIQSMPNGKLVLQLDNFYGGNMTPAQYEVDWVRAYSL